MGIEYAVDETVEHAPQCPGQPVYETAAGNWPAYETAGAIDPRRDVRSRRGGRLTLDEGT